MPVFNFADKAFKTFKFGIAITACSLTVVGSFISQLVSSNKTSAPEWIQPLLLQLSACRQVGTCHAALEGCQSSLHSHFHF